MPSRNARPAAGIDLEPALGRLQRQVDIRGVVGLLVSTPNASVNAAKPERESRICGDGPFEQWIAVDVAFPVRPFEERARFGVVRSVSTLVIGGRDARPFARAEPDREHSMSVNAALR